MSAVPFLLSGNRTPPGGNPVGPIVAALLFVFLWVAPQETIKWYRNHQEKRIENKVLNSISRDKPLRMVFVDRTERELAGLGTTRFVVAIVTGNNKEGLPPRKEYIAIFLGNIYRADAPRYENPEDVAIWESLEVYKPRGWILWLSFIFRL